MKSRRSSRGSTNPRATLQFRQRSRIQITGCARACLSNVDVLLPENGAIFIPTSSISYAPYGDSVFIVKSRQGAAGTADKEVEQQFVKLGASRGDQVTVISGVKEGDEVVSSGVFKLRGGAAVQVNNSVKPGNEAEPESAEYVRRSTAKERHEIHRFVHPPAGRGDGGQPDHPAGGSAGHSQPQRAAVPAQRHRHRHRHDDLCGRERGPGARLHHHAAGARHRQRGRHRLHRIRKARRD